MKKNLIILSTLLLPALALAQPQVPQNLPQIPADKEVRTGKLENGLTYYIRHNAKPEKQAEFYIYHDVGAIQEEDSQQGLAHFLEHMAFNGTKNFPGKGIIDYLETIGVKFGLNLNAGTGQDMTVYNMSKVPLNREGIIDSCLLILHDWSYFITLDGAEIDKERGVIIEELRSYNDAEFRIGKITDPVYYNGAKYAYRDVIGTEQGLKGFAHQELRDFYHRWYRTDLQAIVVVGDVDVDQVEAKIKSIMADIPAVENPVPKVPVIIPDNDKPTVAVATDPEQTTTRISLCVKREPLPKELNSTVMAAQLENILSCATMMLNNRFTEIARAPQAPFVSAYSYQGSQHPTLDIFTAACIARDGEGQKAFDALYTEVEKMRRFGFNESELERVKSDMLRAAQQKYDNRNDRLSGTMPWIYINNFRRNQAMPDAATEWKLDSMTIGAINLQMVNQLIAQLITPQNQCVIIAAPQKEGVSVPTNEDILASISTIREGALEGYAEQIVDRPLISAKLKGGKVVTSKPDKFGATVMALSNGVHVVMLPTDYKADEILVSINSPGGMSLLLDEEYPSAEMLAELLEESGVGGFTPTEIEKLLAGKYLGLQLSLKHYENGMSGTTSPKDMESFLQLVYLYFTQPGFNEQDFNVLIDRYKGVLANVATNPNYQMAKVSTEALYGNNPRRQIISMEKLAQVKFEYMLPIFKKLYSNPANFTFTFVGNIDYSTFKPLVEKYLGSLPTNKTSINWVDDGAVPVKGYVEKRIEVPMQAPKTTVGLTYTGELEYTFLNRLRLSFLKQVLDIRTMESVREEKGGTYGVRVLGSLNQAPVEGYSLVFQFDTNTEMAEELDDLVKEELQKIAKEGPRADDLAKIREYMLKARPDELKLNPTWLNFIDSYYVNGIDLLDNYYEYINAIDAASLRELAERVLKDGNLVEVIMSPAK